MSPRAARTADDDLVRATVRGERAAYSELYSRYRDKVFATVYRIVGNQTEAADVVQDVFIKVYRDLAKFKFQSKFSTWLYRIAVNFSINKVNEYERHGRVHQKIAREGQAGGESQDVPAERVQSTVHRLNPKLRTVVVLRYMQNMAYDEIAEVLDLSVGTVKSRLHLAHNALRENLHDLRGEG